MNSFYYYPYYPYYPRHMEVKSVFQAFYESSKASTFQDFNALWRETFPKYHNSTSPEEFEKEMSKYR